MEGPPALHDGRAEAVATVRVRLQVMVANETGEHLGHGLERDIVDPRLGDVDEMRALDRACRRGNRVEQQANDFWPEVRRYLIVLLR